MPTIRPGIFKIYAHWTYTDKVDIEVTHNHEGEQIPPSFAISRKLIELYVAADILLDVKLKDCVIDQIWNLLQSGRFACTWETLHYVWGSTAQDSALRRLFLALIPGMMSAERLARQPRATIPQDFLYDLA